MQQQVDDFLKTVLRSGLLNRDQLQTALRAAPKERRSDPKGVAEHLILQGKLSRFQAQKLLQGATVGLMLGPYQIQAPIGRGGMGTVYLCLDTRNGQHVALKILPPKRAREEERYLARFRREMEISRKLFHPHLALTYEVGVSHGVYYIAMEYIPGLSLYRLVNREGPLTVSRAARLFAEAAAALEYAHRQGLVHRDLKPSNIMVTPKDHAKVLDLGLALMEGEATNDREVVGGQGYIVGSFDYLAPEQAEDAVKVDGRADIYGLGCALYFALTGRPPFPGGTNREKVRSHRLEEPVPIVTLNPKVPPDFNRLVRRMMAKEPDKRFPSAAAVRQELLAWTSDDNAQPLDRQEDRAYQESVHALEEAEVPSELVGDVIVLTSAEDGDNPTAPLSFLSTSEPNQDYLLLLGLGGFWLILLLGLGLFLLLK
jgi:serine/threonine protein kinase